MVIFLFLISGCSKEASITNNLNKIIQKNKECTIFSKLTNSYGGIGKLCSDREECIQELNKSLLSHLTNSVKCEEIFWTKLQKNCNIDQDCVLVDRFNLTALKEVLRCNNGICEVSEKTAVYNGIIKSGETTDATKGCTMSTGLACKDIQIKSIGTGGEINLMLENNMVDNMQNIDISISGCDKDINADGDDLWDKNSIINIKLKNCNQNVIPMKDSLVSTTFTIKYKSSFTNLDYQKEGKIDRKAE